MLRRPLAEKAGAGVRRARAQLRKATRLRKRGQRSETKRFTQHARRIRRRIGLAVAAVTLLMAFVLLSTLTPLMAVREVRLSGQQQVDAAQVTAALSRFKGEPLALIDDNEVLDALHEFPLIQTFAVERIPPHTLLVRITERTPVIAIVADGKYRNYDAAGVLLHESDAPLAGVPVAAGGVAQPDSAAFAAAAITVRDMPQDLRTQLREITADSNQTVSLTLHDGITVFWGSSELTKRKALVLATMRTALASTSYTHIDVSAVDAPIYR